MMLEQGFARGNAVVRLGQLAEALVRLARAVVGIRLHAEDLSVEQGVRFFREEAFVEESRARGEAERGTFDPGYVLYALGKQMLLKLRADCEAGRGQGVLAACLPRPPPRPGTPAVRDAPPVAARGAGHAARLTAAERVTDAAVRIPV